MTESNNIQVNMAEGKVAKAPAVLEALGLGSCVAICLYEPKLKIGGMAHAMLASAKTLKTAENNADISANNVYRYADTAINQLIIDLEKLGAQRNCLEAKLAGGADMFGFDYPPPKDNLGRQIVETVIDELNRLNIKIKGNDTGGTIGRSVHFDLESGLINIITKM